jgi:uncharacterized protein (DUF1684 family)
VTNSYEDEVEAWRTQRMERLRSPESWFSLVGLWWLRPGTNTIGSDPLNDVLLPGEHVVAHAGTIDLEPDGRVVLHATPESGLRHRSEPVTDLELSSTAPITRIRSGSLSFTLIRREHMAAIRVRDRDRPARIPFAGIGHFPVNPAWRVEARLEPVADRREVVVPAVAGPGERYVVAGAAVFEVPLSDAAGEHRLVAFEEEPGQDLFFVFGDATSRTETYPGGRFMYMPPPDPADPQRRMVIDFNRAYNPPCVFTEFATCPVPLPENRLPFRVEAGELRYTGDSTG